MTKATGKTIGVVLAGCGYLDGAEIHEATLTLLALDRAGVTIRCMAPKTQQMHVVDHSAGAPEEGTNRNVFTESARIARGDLEDIADVQADELDALVFPGGFGAAKNLCSFAVDGPDCTINSDVERLIKGINRANKPLGFICISPAIAAKALGDIHPLLTIGTDEGTAAAIERLGARHQNCAVDDIVVDGTNNIVSTPAYMLGPSIAHVAKGIDKLVEAVLDML